MGKYRIRKLDIEGFRIYSKKQSINVFKNLTVVYGKNGRGKTTLQDAIGWLFNNNITRYSSYRGEWNRAKKTHIRSLINPEIETKITGYFEEVSTADNYFVTRDETQLMGSEILKKSLFYTSVMKNDLLWANSLSQSKLQDLAIANGRDRLENLAPLLDLTEINNQIRDIDDELKEYKGNLKDYKNQKKEISRSDQTETFYNITLKINKLENKLTKFIKIPMKPQNNFSSTLEVEEWNQWFENLLENLTEKKVKINKFLKDISEEDIILTLENHTGPINENVEMIEKELDEIKKKKSGQKKKVHQLNQDRSTIQQEIKVINSLFDNLNRLQISLKNKEEEVSDLDSKVSKHKSIEEEIKKYKDNLSTLSKQQAELENKRDVNINNRININNDYSNFINQVENIQEYTKRIVEIETWINENSDRQNQKLLQELELELENYDNTYNDIYDKQKVTIDLYDSFTEKVSGKECPLCGMEHSTENHLIEAINLQKRKSVKNLLALNDKFLKIKEKVSNIKKINIRKQEKEKTLQDIRRLLRIEEEEYLENKREIEKISATYNVENTVLNEKLFSHLLEYNKEENFRIIKELDELKRSKYKISQKYNSLKEIIISEKNLYQDAMNKTSSIKNEVDVIIKEIKERLSLYEYNNKIDESTIIEFLHVIQKEKDLQIERIQSKEFIKETRVLKTGLYKNYIYQQNMVTDIYLEIKEIKEFISVIEESIKIMNDSEKLDYKISELKEKIQSLNNTRSNLRETQRIETNKEIGKMASRISMIFEMLSDTSPWKTIKSDAVVPGTRERTNLIFRAIPHKYEKNQQDYIENTQSNSTFAFSGGQLSLLGLSIFLSQVADVHSNNEGILDTIILDDPIQMLDTLRDEALVSLICDIAQEKQVIISTSDISFANKLILASRPIWELENGSCGVLYFDKLEEDGPIIEEVEPEKWINDQRIYLPKLKKVSS